VTIRFEPTPQTAADPGDPREAARRQHGRAPDPRIAPALLAQGAAAGSLERLLTGGALAVTTGQQAGLFTGPLYAVLKGLSAAALAAELSEGGTPHVPVFWVAGDDHDFAEINHTTVIGQDGRPVHIVLRERPTDAPMLPAYREPVGEDGARALDALEAALPPSDFRTETLAWLRRGYAPGGAVSVAEAYARVMAELLAPYGVVIARGWDGVLKSAATEVLLGAARNASVIDHALAALADRLRARGAPVPVDVGEGLSLLMLETPQGRDRLRITGPGRFQTRRGEAPVTVEELEGIIAASPERVSGNVLLRPVIEAAVFPTVAYLGGPGELAYLAQTAPVFDLLRVARPARLPRLSGFLVEAKVDKVLERFGLAPGDLAQSEGALASRIAREDLPASAAAALADLRSAVTERYAAVQAEAAAVDKTLGKTVESARNQALVGAQEIEKKLVAALRRSNDTAIQQAARARDQLFPGGVPQEREVSVVSFLARHGRGVLDLLYGAARSHARRVLEAAPGGA
jgi:bacillithiol biosynthesis cysteine-adding enzyme BshC